MVRCLLSAENSGNGVGSVASAPYSKMIPPLAVAASASSPWPPIGSKTDARAFAGCDFCDPSHQVFLCCGDYVGGAKSKQVSFLPRSAGSRYADGAFGSGDFNSAMPTLLLAAVMTTNPPLSGGLDE